MLTKKEKYYTIYIITNLLGEKMKESIFIYWNKIKSIEYCICETATIEITNESIEILTYINSIHIYI